MKRLLIMCLFAGPAAATFAFDRQPTGVSIQGGQWYLDGQPTYPGTRAQGLMMNVRMVNAIFDDANERTRPMGFAAGADRNEAQTARS